MDLNRDALLVVLKYVPVNSKILVAGERCNAGFSIEGGTWRLIAAYFGIYSRLLCV